MDENHMLCCVGKLLVQHSQSLKGVPELVNQTEAFQPFQKLRTDLPVLTQAILNSLRVLGLNQALYSERGCIVKTCQ